MSVRTDPVRPSSKSSSSRAVVLLCFLVLVLEGYDLLMFGTVVPSLLHYKPWGLDAPAVGVLGSLAGIGMLVGALAAAGTGDRWGRRRTILVSVATFSVAMGACAIAPSSEIFGLSRFFVGLGTGALMPIAVAILVEFAAAGRRNRTTAYGFAGVGVGGMVAGLLSIWLVPTFGFRAMFVAGVVPLFVVLPLVARYLPESPAFLLARGRRADAERIAAHYDLALVELGTASNGTEGQGIRAIFSRNRVAATLLFWVATFFCLLVLFGVASWLPALMTKAGYGLVSSLSFILVLNAGAVVGVLAASPLSDRWGAKPVTVASFAAAAVALALLSTAPPTWAVYLLVAVAGLGTTGTQILLNAFVAIYYPAGIRTTGLGMSLGVGRIGAIAGPTYGGLLVGAQLSLSWQFYAFAIPSVVGAVATAVVPLRHSAAHGEHGAPHREHPRAAVIH